MPTDVRLKVWTTWCQLPSLIVLAAPTDTTVNPPPSRDQAHPPPVGAKAKPGLRVELMALPRNGRAPYSAPGSCRTQEDTEKSTSEPNSRSVGNPSVT